MKKFFVCDHGKVEKSIVVEVPRAYADDEGSKRGQPLGPRPPLWVFKNTLNILFQ